MFPDSEIVSKVEIGRTKMGYKYALQPKCSSAAPKFSSCFDESFNRISNKVQHTYFLWNIVAIVGCKMKKLFVESWKSFHIWKISSKVWKKTKAVQRKMMMMMMNCFCGMVDWRKVFSLISSRDHCQRSSPSGSSPFSPGRIWTCAEPEFRLC